MRFLAILTHVSVAKESDFAQYSLQEERRVWKLYANGIGGDGEKWIVDGKRLVDVAGRFISNAEAAARIGVRPESSTAVRKALRDCGITLPTTYGWVRAEVFEKAGALVNRGPFLRFN